MRRFCRRIDSLLTTWIVRLPAAVRPLMQLASLIGHPLVTVSLSTGIGFYAIVEDQKHLTLLCLVALLTFAISSLMKLCLRRPRPATEYVDMMWLQTFSFPSGHSAGSAVSFGLIGYLLIHLWPAHGLLIAGFVTILCFAVGISRVYLGAHYPSDVFGGWLVAAIGIVIIVLIGI